MAVYGITFNEQLIQSADMAHMFWTLCGKKSGITSGCAVSYSGTNLYVAAGYLLAHGRLTKMTGTTTIAAPTVTEGTTYCRLVYEIDLTKTNTESNFTQGYFKVLTSTTAYPSLTQQDLDDGGTLYQFPMARFTMTSTGIGSWTDETVAFDTMTEITLTVADWAGSGPYTQTVSVDRITAASKPVQGIVYPTNCTDAQRKAIQKSASYICSMTTTAGSVTFTATRKPSVALTIGLSI